MVSGFTKFKERFQGFENQYVIIGGTACDLIMENEELPFRATKDVDIVLIVESITALMTCIILGHLDGLGIGTILAAFTMGKVIGMIGDKMDQHVRFESFMTKRV